MLAWGRGAVGTAVRSAFVSASTSVWTTAPPRVWRRCIVEMVDSPPPALSSLSSLSSITCRRAVASCPASSAVVPSRVALMTPTSSWRRKPRCAVRNARGAQGELDRGLHRCARRGSARCKDCGGAMASRTAARWHRGRRLPLRANCAQCFGCDARHHAHCIDERDWLPPGAAAALPPPKG